MSLPEKIVKTLLFFAFVFATIMFLNQFLFYGACFKSYCIENATPKVLVFSTIITGFFFYIFFSDERSVGKSVSSKDEQSRDFTRENRGGFSSVNTHVSHEDNLILSDFIEESELNQHFNKNCTSGMFRFSNFKEASCYAKQIQKKEGSNVKIKLDGNEFVVSAETGKSLIHKTKQFNPQEITTYIDDEEFGFIEEFDEVNELLFELDDYAESLARSEEEGWFYSDDDDEVNERRD